MRSKYKLKELVNQDLRKPQLYLSSSCLAEVRMAARIQLRMVRCAGNMGKLFRGNITCEQCAAWLGEGEGAPIDTQEHMAECRAYRFLQERYYDRELNFESLSRYFMDLM